MDENAPRIMDENECWEFLRSHEFGRLAFHLAEEVHIAPVNYAVDHRTLLFRTAAGSKLLGIVMNDDVAFEVDEHDDTRAASVILRGTARLLPEDEAHRSENVPLRPWVDDFKYNVVEISPTSVSGRRFDLSKPWTRITPRD